MAFFLFILVNATLFIRPAEVFGAQEFENVYQYLIIACLVVSLPEVLACLTGRPLDTQPMTLCVLGILLCIPPAFLIQGQLGEAVDAGMLFLKVAIYFILLVSLVNTPQRLRTFILSLLIFGIALTLIVVLRFHDVIELKNLKLLVDSSKDRVTGEIIYFNRLQGSGIFQDPNELCVILATLVPLALFALTDRKSGALRILWLAGLLLFFYGIYLTKSRGGFIALVAGLGAFTWARFGFQRAAAIGLVGLPMLVLVFAGRQVEISASENTGKTRVQLWSDWMMEFRMHPFVGKGISLPKEEEYIQTPGEARKHLAHNSYLQAFADMGFVGGLLFLGLFYVALWALIRSGHQATILEPSLRSLHPYLLGAVAAYAVGLLSLSICYVVPTYMMAGLAAAFTRMALVVPIRPPIRLTFQVLGRFAVCSVAYLALIYVFVRVFINWA